MAHDSPFSCFHTELHPGLPFSIFTLRSSHPCYSRLSLVLPKTTAALNILLTPPHPHPHHQFTIIHWSHSALQFYFFTCNSIQCCHKLLISQCPTASSQSHMNDLLDHSAFFLTWNSTQCCHKLLISQCPNILSLSHMSDLLDHSALFHPQLNPVLPLTTIAFPVSVWITVR